MTARRILGHLRAAFANLTAATREAREAEAVARREGSGRGVAPIVGTPGGAHARAAIAHLVEAASLISPAAGVRVAEAARRAFDDAHRRAVARNLDAHGLDEGGAAACAAEGTGLDVVDVIAGGADEEGLHGGERSTVVEVHPGSYIGPAEVRDEILRSLSRRNGRLH